MLFIYTPVFNTCFNKRVLNTFIDFSNLVKQKTLINTILTLEAMTPHRSFHQRHVVL